MANNYAIGKKVPLPSGAVREKLINPDFLKPFSVPDISGKSPMHRRCP